MDESAPSILEVERRYSIDSPEEREQRFRVLFDDGPVGIVLLGSDFRFIAVNGAFCKMLKYAASELLNRSFADITQPDDRVSNLDTARRFFAGEGSAVRVEKRYLTKDGEVVDVHLTGWPIRDSAGQITHSVHVARNIHGPKAGEEEDCPASNRAHGP